MSTVMTRPVLRISALLAGAFLLTHCALAQESDPENFHMEVLGSAWIVDPSGTVHSDGTYIDLISDLNFGQQVPTFSGKLVFKPRRRQRILVEGTPLTANGLNAINRTITYGGTTFNLSDTIRSSVNLNVVLVGYGYDVISNRYGHLGLSVSGMYLDGTGTLTSIGPASSSSTSTERIGLAIAGTEARLFPIPRHPWLDLNGTLRGMTYGNYGHYVEWNMNGGVWLAKRFTIEAGYRRIDTQLQDSNDPLTNSGLNVHIRGPIVSAGFRW